MSPPPPRAGRALNVAAEAASAARIEAVATWRSRRAAKRTRHGGRRRRPRRRGGQGREGRHGDGRGAGVRDGQPGKGAWRGEGGSAVVRRGGRERAVGGEGGVGTMFGAGRGSVSRLADPLRAVRSCVCSSKGGGWAVEMVRHGTLIWTFCWRRRRLGECAKGGGGGRCAGGHRWLCACLLPVWGRLENRRPAELVGWTGGRLRKTLADATAGPENSAARSPPTPHPPFQHVSVPPTDRSYTAMYQ